MTVDPLLSQWPWYVLLSYLLIKEVLKPLMESLLPKILPLKFEQRKNQAQERLDQVAREQDLREREVTALEQIGKALVLLEHENVQMITLLQAIQSKQSDNHEMLRIITDRNSQRRKGDKPQEDKPVQ
jgi:hypothetical protein